jgi:CheY-like chemotaxis protein
LKTLLVVDDELSGAEVLGLILEEEGYRVFTAANGRQGLQRAQEVRPDLVILDFMMPVMDGAEMGQRLRSLPGLSTIKIVMCSSVEEDTVREFFTGYDAFLRKPFDIDRALAVIARLLQD